MLNLKKDLNFRRHIEHCKRTLRVIKNSIPKKSRRQKLIEERTRLNYERDELRRIIRSLERNDNYIIQYDLMNGFEESMRNIHIWIMERRVDYLTKEIKELSTMINGTADWNDKFCG